MILVNLLPEDRRPVERTPLPRFLTILGGVIGLCLEGVFIVFLMTLIPQKELDLGALELRKQQAVQRENQVKALEAQIQKIGERKKGVAKLADDRRIWAPILYQLTDPEVLPERVWFKTMKLEKRASAVRGGPDQETLVIEGYAWATDSDDTPSMIHTAMKFVSNLQQPRVNFSEFFVGAPEMGKLSDGPLRARSGGGASIVDGPTRALSFSVKMPLKNRAVAPVPVAP